MNNLNLDEYKEVTKTEYSKHKRKSDKEYAETLRFGFKYFIKKKNIFENEYYRLEIHDMNLFVESKVENKVFCFGSRESLPLLKEAIKSMDEK